MKSKKLTIAILLILAVASIVKIAFTLYKNFEELDNFLYQLSIEILGAVIIIICFDLIVNDRVRKGELKAALLRDLYSQEEEIRVMALDRLLNEHLLEGTILNDIDLKTLNLNSRNFENVDFLRCNFFGSQLKGTTFNQCKFSKTDFSGANLNDSRLNNCKFNNCTFSGTFFEETYISNSTFDSCNLDNSRFVHTHIFNTKFGGCSAEHIVAMEVNVDEVSSASFSMLGQ